MTEKQKRAMRFYRMLEGDAVRARDIRNSFVKLFPPVYVDTTIFFEGAKAFEKLHATEIKKRGGK